MEIAAVFALAFLTEGLTEYFVAPLLGIKGSKFLRHIAALVGIALCLTYRVDLFTLFLGLTPRLAYLGQVFTGLALGRGANFLHDIYSGYVRPK